LTKLYHLTAEEVSSGIKNLDFSAEEYIFQILERIEKIDVKINAFTTVNKNCALKTARSIDKKIRDEEKNIGPLAGVAIGIKDNICTRGLKTTCASRMLEEYVPPYDATVVKKLKDSGAIIIGKLNLDEFAMGSDTGGSVRCPASFCSVVGLKPTYGCVSRFGLISYANSLEQIGPMGKTVYDVMMVMNSIAGMDDNDQTTLVGVPKYTIQPKKNIRVGLVKELVEGAVDEVSKCIYYAMDLFAKSDCKCEETSMKSIEYALASYYTIAMAEASSNLARYDNIRYGFVSSPDTYEWNTYFAKVRSNFGEEVKRRIIIGSYVLSSGYYGKYYMKAQKIRSLLKQEIASLYKKYDVLIAPTMPILPFKFGERIDDPLKMYSIDVDTVLANLTGIPAISVPAGFSKGLPIGLQIMAKESQEQTLFDAASLFESTANVQRSPEL
jgi:aspartyl-tRNA(Asn)/glutamyl-tRNA(Gln) amidotransferase subunit A